MKNKKVWAIAAIAAALFGLVFVFLNDKVSVSASTVALAEQGWKANFSSELQQDAIDKGNVYITDSQGQTVDVEMIIHDNGKTLEIPEIPTGEYQLHIKRAALKNSFLKSLVNTEVSFTVQEQLEQISGKEELRNYFAQLLEMQQNNEWYGGTVAESGEETAESSDSTSGESEAGAGGDYSTTNNQVEGVDEADLVKTDGSYIYSISEGRVMISDVRNSEEMAVAAELPFTEETYPQQLFLSGDTLVILGSSYSAMPMDDFRLPHSQSPYLGLTSIYLYDVSNPQSPRLIREFGAEGNLSGARLTNNILYFVTNVYPDYWVLEEQSEPELRPHRYDSKNGGELEPLPYDSIAILPGTTEGSYSVITAIDLNEPETNDISTEGFLGGSEQLYMNEENLFLTAAAYVPLNDETQASREMAIWLPQQANTEVFKFELDGTAVEFLASAEITGSLLNQFSMDEHNGYFRAVTTEGVVWDLASPSKNHLFILDGQMNQVGSVEDLAPGERIYSARFIGDKAYMVTFKETDPLFVIDVSEPSSPQVLGELKIPGFSNYLHPLDDDHLIGFGYDTKLLPVKNGEPRVVTGGMKISLFDVSDFSDPVEKDTEIIGGPGTYSTLQYDHKALFTHKEKNLFGFPAALYEESTGDYVEFEGEGALIYTITPDGISQAASLIEPTDSQYEDWNTAIQRILYIGGELYTVANGEIKCYNMETFEPIGSLAFNQ
ncbi:beta-propeller domain-containing protein [Planococcus sp. ISL-110]|uniref:beta-propeller domain-containing protein n=1 Tax=Planococcus sp. ISL-110 TaxID=2819167 RepID=UPI001BE5EF75|nr:beta-propeller domain-containing protein [Planococcus sp. ISL-110]